MRVGLVAEHGERRLFVEHLAAEPVDETRRLVAHGAHHRLVESSASLEELADQHALVDQGHRRAVGVERAAAVLAVARIGNDAVDAERLEIVLEEHELVVRGHLAPVEDGDARGLARPAPFVERAKERVDRVGACEQRPHLPAALIFAHHGQREEQLAEHVPVRGAGRRLGVVLGKANGRGIGGEEGIEPRQRAPLPEAVVFGDQCLFRCRESKLRAEVRVGQRRPIQGVERPEQSRCRALHHAVLRDREHPRAQHVAQRPLAEPEPASGELFAEEPPRLRREGVVEQGVVRVDRGRDLGVVHAVTTCVLCGRPGTGSSAGVCRCAAFSRAPRACPPCG